MSLRLFYCLLICAFLCLALPVFGASKCSDQFTQAKQMMEEGSKTFNIVLLENSRNLLIKLFQTTNHDYLTAYDVAYVDNKLIDIYANQKDSQKASFYIEEALKYLDESIKLNDHYSDAHCLLAGILGQKISLKGITAGFIYQKKTSDSLKKAKEIDPNNPDVYLGLGISAVATPSLFGGDVDKGIDFLNKALELDPTKYRAYVWLCKAYRSKGENKRARTMILEALKHNPYDLGAKKELASFADN